MKRMDKENYYLDIAGVVLERGTCLRRNYGAVIVNNDVIISTGYNGSPRGRKNCCDIGSCAREDMEIPRGERFELCRSVHAEVNAIIAASRDEMMGATLYLVGADAKSGLIVSDACSCAMCKRVIINSGITHVVVRNTKETFTIYNVRDWIFNDDSLPGEKFSKGY